MNIMSFVRDKVTYITALLLSDMAVGVFLYLIDVKGIFILFLMILWNVSFFIVFFMEYWQKQKYYRHVNELITMLDKKTLLADLLKEEASFLDGQILESVIAVTDKYMNDLTSEYERSAKEYREYVEMWVHEIKTPLTVANLLIDSHKDEVTKKIGTQLQQVDNFVEQALFYARSTSLEKDFLVKQVTLKELVTEAVKQNAKTLIGARMSVELDEAQLDYEVYADPKWMTFILGQIITNAVKYRSQEHSAIHFTGNSYADITYQTFFEGQDISLWEHDKALQNKKVDVFGISDYNKALVAQGKEELSLGENEFLLNCNYEGTREYMKNYMECCEGIELGGRMLYPKQKEVLEHTFYMTSIGDNDRGTLIVPDEHVEALTKTGLIAQGFFYEEVNINEVHTLLDYFIWDSGVPEDKPFGWNTRERMNTMFYSAFGLPVFLFSYIGIVFMLICVALISVQQLTEVSDNKYRYLILQKQGVKKTMMKSTIQKQVGVYFIAPLLLAGIYSTVALPAAIRKVSSFYNMQIGMYLVFTLFVLLLVYGGYYLATAASCKRMILREKE